MSLENKYCDLHTHSTASDGSFSPEEIVLEAKRLGIAVALTDHNTVAGLPEFLRAAEKHGVPAVPGVEITCEYRGREMHMLALFLKESSLDAFAEFTEPVRESKNRNNRALVDRLAADGFPVGLDRLMREKGDGYVNRSDIAAEMVRLGYVRSINDAFDGMLSENGKYYKPDIKVSAMDVIDFIVRAGAIPVIAHPYLDYTTEELDRFIPEAKMHGLAGMETSYSEYSPATQRAAEETAMRHGLLMSGGSDFHGNRKSDIDMMTGRGDLRVPYEYYQKLKKCANMQN